MTGGPCAHVLFLAIVLLGGKGRSKQEASSHTNHHDPSGQTRKIVTKMQNTEKNRLEAGGDKGPAQKKVAAPAEED